jgi:hypothetical protein
VTIGYTPTNPKLRFSREPFPGVSRLADSTGSAEASLPTTTRSGSAIGVYWGQGFGNLPEGHLYRYLWGCWFEVSKEA